MYKLSTKYFNLKIKINFTVYYNLFDVTSNYM